MGALCSSESALSKELRKRNQAIDKELQRAKRKMMEEIRILLLGTGESGKSTVFKQMRIMNQGYGTEEKSAFKRIIDANVLSQIKVLVAVMARLRIEPHRADNFSNVQVLAQAPMAATLTPEMYGAIKSLWDDECMQEVMSHRNKVFQLNDSAEYFFSELGRLSASNYVPNEQDILRARVRSTGIEEAPFVFGELEFILIDVGGQRNERRKWIHCFDQITCLLFVCGLSEYDQVLREDETQNRMKESLLLFDEICNSPWFRKTAIILFLNKTDLFKQKLKFADLRNCFPEYFGGPDFDKATKFIQERFIELNRSRDHQVYTHLTCAIDTSQMRVVFNAVKEVMLRQVLKQVNIHV